MDTMTKTWTCTFQHFQSGMHVSATFQSKKLTLGMVDSLEEMRPYINNDRVYLDTQEWCKEHTNKRFEDVEKAKDYLVSLGVEDYIDFENV